LERSGILRHDPIYQHFSIEQLESLARLHRSKKKRQRGKPDHSLHPSESQAWDHPVPFLGLFQHDYSLCGVQHGASYPGKPDVDTKPGTEVETEGPRLYDSMHDIASHQRGSASSTRYHTIQELAKVLYGTTTAAKVASLFARQLVANSTFITQAVPILLLPDNNDFQDIPFPSLSITFENGTATILPLAINLAAVPIRTHKEYVRPAIFWSRSIMRILEHHNWMMVHISDVYQCQSTEPYVFEHLHYLTASINTSAHISLSHASSTQAAWPAATWRRYSRFDALARAIYTSSRRAYIEGNNVQPFRWLSYPRSSSSRTYAI
jgi:hypothetical protein